MIAKETIKQSFNSSAVTYDSVASVQVLASRQLAQWVPQERIDSILDIGCGTGNTALEFYKKYPQAQFTLCDLAPTMLERAVQKFPIPVRTLCCDAETYPFTQHYDLAVANLSLQWFSNPSKFLQKIKQCCTTFAFSALLSTSFQRYRDLFDIPPTFQYLSAQEWRSLVKSPKIFTTQRCTLEFPNFFAVAKYFKKLGAGLKGNTHHSPPRVVPHQPIFLDYDLCFVLC